jgi:hypothetical protein
VGSDESGTLKEAGIMGIIGERLQQSRVHRPYTLAFATILPIPGVLALLYGDRVSQALSNIAAGVISRGMGAALVVGGVLIIVGIVGARSLIEAVGMCVLAAGCALYAAGVLLGLGLGGVVAGGGFLAITIGTVLRVVSLMAVAQVAAHVYDPHGDGDE